MVVSVAEKPGARFRQARLSEASVSKPLMKCRNFLDDVKTGGWHCLRDQLGGRPDVCPSGIRHVGGATLNQALVRNVRTCAPMPRELYKLWNRMSSGSYFPPPVRRVDIPKADGGTRPLGIPTVADRIAQEVARRYLEPILEPLFHVDSYGYRPGKSAIDAVRTARQRCWRYDWVLDLDVRSYFDSIDWELMPKAVRRPGDCPWVLLYIERWLRAPVQMEDGSIVPRTAGTPQGGVISPLLANLLLHYVFDMWMAREFPHIPFERYADDAICHCRRAEEAQALW